MIIGLSGQKRSGKTTAANFFKEKGFIPITLADGFKSELAYVLHRELGKNISLDDVNGETSFDRESKIFTKDEMIKTVCRVVNNLTDSNYNELIKKEINSRNQEFFSVREMMQVIGTDIVVNQIDKYFWVKLALDKITVYIKHGKCNFIITDLRVDYELDFFRVFNSKIIHIKKDTGFTDSHITEQPSKVENQDFVIDNNNTLEIFYTKLNSLYNKLTDKE